MRQRSLDRELPARKRILPDYLEMLPLGSDGIAAEPKAPLADGGEYCRLPFDTQREDTVFAS